MDVGEGSQDAASDGKIDPTAQGKIDVLRHPDSGESIAEVPMLIDSGADATLLRRSAVALLGIMGTGERYQLEAFDGTTNE